MATKRVTGVEDELTPKMNNTIEVVQNISLKIADIHTTKSTTTIIPPTKNTKSVTFSPLNVESKVNSTDISSNIIKNKTTLPTSTVSKNVSSGSQVIPTIITSLPP